MDINIAEQVIRAKQDLDDVYSAGQSSMVDESKLIPKTVSGSYISVDDVSEIPHSVGCKVESVNLCPINNVEYTQLKKISFAKPLPAGTYTFSGIITSEQQEKTLLFRFIDEDDKELSTYGCYSNATRRQGATRTFSKPCSFFYVYSSQSYVESSGIKGSLVDFQVNEGTTALPYTPYVKLEEVTVTRIGKNLATAQQVFKGFGSYGETVLDGRNAIRYLTNVSAKNTLPILEANTQYTISFDGKTTLNGTDNATSPFLYVYYTDGTRSIFGSTVGATDWTHYEFVTTAGKSVSAIGVESYTYKIWHWVDVDTFQIEKGATATTYEPYNGQTLTPATDGIVEGMTSVSPYMNIFSDTEGVNIEATYNKSYGMQTEYDRFWDAFQENGKRINYYQAFGFGDSASRSPWTNQNFKPKYPIKPRYVNNMFTNFGYRGDVTEAAEIDFSNAWAVYNIFVNCPWITRVGVINCTGMEEGGGALLNACTALETVDKFIFRNDGLQKMSSLTFTGCTSLKNIAFEGKANFDINFKDSPLSKASITSVINTLYEGSTGKTLTLKLSAVNTAFETSAGANDGSTSAEFAALVATKTNWTITMI